MLGENHSIHHEFPEHHDLVDRLMTEDVGFKTMVDEYNSLDKEIRVFELHGAPIDDLTFEKMKKRRIQLKDKVYNILLTKS